MEVQGLSCGVGVTADDSEGAPRWRGQQRGAPHHHCSVNAAASCPAYSRSFASPRSSRRCHREQACGCQRDRAVPRGRPANCRRVGPAARGPRARSGRRRSSLRVRASLRRERWSEGAAGALRCGAGRPPTFAATSPHRCAGGPAVRRVRCFAGLLPAAAWRRRDGMRLGSGRSGESSA